MAKNAHAMPTRPEIAMVPVLGGQSVLSGAGLNERRDDLRASRGIAMAVLLSLYLWCFGGLALWLW
jgi:hypothetical protein